MPVADCPALPKGWKREEIVRKRGYSAGKTDVYYYSPTGERFRSKPELARFLGDAVDLSSFDYRTGKINSSLLRKSKRHAKTQFDYNRNLWNAASLVPPIRQTTAIMKQPVTVIKSNDVVMDFDIKDGNREKPIQLLWKRRLLGLRASNMDEDAFNDIELPRSIKDAGVGVRKEVYQRSSTVVSLDQNQLKMRQATLQHMLKENAFGVDLDKPLEQALVFTQEDMKNQEEKVELAKKELQACLKELCPE